MIYSRVMHFKKSDESEQFNIEIITFYAILEIGMKTQIMQNNQCPNFLPFLGYRFY
jgi:hypothetical protein